MQFMNTPENHMQAPLTTRLGLTDSLVMLVLGLVGLGFLYVEIRRWEGEVAEDPLILGTSGFIVLSFLVITFFLHRYRARFRDGPSWWVMGAYSVTTILIPFAVAFGLANLLGVPWIMILAFLLLFALIRVTTYPLLRRTADG
jgi:hypothetical protein